MSMAASSSSSSSCGFDPSLCKHDVFISFRGGDTRRNFTSHLYDKLCRNKIRAYIDEESLRKGDDISRALPTAIEESAISIIVFSKNFAFSTWCLDELVHILKCKKNKAQIVLPIFHDVDPSDIRKQKKSYAAAFVKHKKRFKNEMNKVRKWKQALKKASKISGWDTRGKSEANIVEEVVKDVNKKLKGMGSNGRMKLKDMGSNGRIEDLRERLEAKLRSVNLVLNDAEEKQLTNQVVKEWVDDLKEVIFRAEESMDKIEYEELRREQEGASESLTSFATSVEDEIEEILRKLEELTAKKDELGMKVLPLRSHGAHLAVESEIYGREDDKEAIMKLVQSDNKPMVVPIVGMGGIGKTTLAQLVFNDQRVENHFEIKVWVCVSTESDVLNITKQIFKGVTTTESSIEVLYPLQSELRKALEGKKFLFVLDDVWDEDFCFWNELRSPFAYGASGSKIIITTRSKIVASMVNNNCKEHYYNLRGLNDSICWEFFFRHAFENEDLNDHPDLRKIGEEIVRKYEGLPVAVKSVAATLGSVSGPKKWRKILENKIWDLKLQETTSKNILPVLWLSYNYLSPQLKRCFAYCSIFPKDHEFLKREVILLWMAEGLLQSKGKATKEDVGDDYFKTLTSRSFFQPVKSKSSFTMHGCMHDLATFVLGDFGFRLEENNLDNLQSKARHLFIMKKYIGDLKQIEGLSKAKFLRTFLALEFNQSSRQMVPLQDLARKEGRLRVVSLPHFLSITELPDSVGNLKYLRYLDLSRTAISEIPSTICSLYNLETLLLKCCRKLTRLPAEIGGLLKLRHIDLDNSAVKEFPLQIRKLKDLQTLTRFIVCEEDGGSRINELGDLKHLRGKLDIWGLENVVDVENVSAAKLSAKTFLTRLGLYWHGDSAGSSDPVKQRQVLDRLHPHTNLKTLYISGYNGKNFSGWMGNQSFRNIERVDLVECRNCNSLSPIEQLPLLKELFISKWLVETLRSEFNSIGSSMTEGFKHLEVLSFENMLNWKEWLITDGAVFPCLKQLEFLECPKLDVRLPDCFPALTMLVVSCCRQLMPLLSPGNTRQGRGGGFSSLEELEIFACPEQMAFSNEALGLPSSVNISTPDLPPYSGD